MALLFVPTPQGGRRQTTVNDGISVSRALVKTDFSSAGARFGVERKVGLAWVPVPLSYVIRKNDELRIRVPEQTLSAGDGLVQMLLNLLPQLTPRRKKAPR